MTQTIKIDVTLDERRVPADISWSASQTSAEALKKAKAMMLAFWDGTDRTALRMDLWTTEMMVDEMADFFYQTLITMADTFERATHEKELVSDIKDFAKNFYRKFQEIQMKQNKA